MKTTNLKKIALGATLIFASVFANAKNAGVESKNEMLNIRKQLNKQINFPKELKQDNLNEKVSVYFKIDEFGNTKLSRVETTNEKLKTFLEKEFNDITIKTEKENLNKMYNVTIGFMVL